ncbi:uncharacterized protein [Branchiostoma lanceolatum]|uniref:uncharacterized protein n=1 Tax=Branchiostoma lanceolatum TaxID=7740 RepID=UPI003455183B
MFPTTGNDMRATNGLSIAQRLDPDLVKTLFTAVLCLGGFIVTTIGFSTTYVTPAMYIGPLMLAVCFVLCLVKCVQWHGGIHTLDETTEYAGRTVSTDRTVPGQVVIARPTPATSTSRQPNMAAPTRAWPYPSYSRYSQGNRQEEQVPYPVPYPPMGARPSLTSPTAPTNPVLPPYTPAAWAGDEPPPSYDEATKSYPEK